MTIKLETRTVFRCKCVRCKHEWDALKKPKRCAKCKYLTWNGEDHRFTDPYAKVPAASQIETGKKAPSRLYPKAILDTFIKARVIINQLIHDNPCEHAKGACVCNEREVLAEMDRQIAKLQIFGANDERYVKSGNAEPAQT